MTPRERVIAQARRIAELDGTDRFQLREPLAALDAEERIGDGMMDYLAAKDRSAAEHSDTRSACPDCGEWRDSPASDCAACGYAPEGRTPDQIDDDLDAMAPGNFT